MNPIIRYDQRVTIWFQNWPTALHPLMFAMTQLGSVALVICASVVVAIVAHARQQYRLMLAFLCVIPGEFLNAGLKLVFNRMRPETQFAHEMLLHTKSFPSGHAYGSMMFYGLLAYLAFTRLPHGWNWAIATLLTCIILLIGISRVYLGAHYFLDVMAGWILGLCSAIVVIKLTKI